MDIEVINQHWDTFLHWKNGGKVLVNFKNTEDRSTLWELTSNPSWINRYSYVIDDEYSNLRCAFADGEVIQFYSMPSGGEWVDEPNPDWTSATNFYRIKQDIELKKGDWVRGKYTNHIFQIDTISETYEGIYYTYKKASGLETQYPANTLDLWEPKEGDSVICWVDNFPKVIDQLSSRLGWLILATNGGMVKDYPNVIPYVGQPINEMKV